MYNVDVADGKNIFAGIISKSAVQGKGARQVIRFIIRT